MAIWNAFTRNQRAEEKYFLALVITSVSVQAGLWRVSNGELTVENVSSTKMYEDEKSLLIAADQVLQELGKESEETDEVVFGFELDWVTESGIKPERKPLLKQLSSELSLKPVGFVVIPEALLHSLEKEDPQATLLLIQIAVHQLTVTLVNQGTIITSERVGRSEDTVSDVNEALARFNTEATGTTLPGKMLIVGIGIDQSVVKEQQQALLTYDWMSSHDFIHPPVIESLPERAVVNSVIEEGGKAVAQSQGLSIVEQEDISQPGVAGDSALLHADQETSAYQSQQTSTADFTQNVRTVDWSQVSHSDQAESSELERTVEVDDDSTGAAEQKTQAGVMASATNLTAHVPKVEAFFQKFAGRQSEQTGVNRSLKVARPHEKGARSPRPFILLGFVAGLLTLGVLALAGTIFGKQAQVQLQLAQKTLAKEITVTLDPEISQSDPEKLLLKASTLTKRVSGSDSTLVTGVQEVGEKATGTVTLFNKTDSVRSFSAGTQLKAGSVVFTLDEGVEVASASVNQDTGGESETRVFGKADAKVTATEIGTTGNIAKDVELQVSDFASSSYTAVAKEAFTGGSSREVRVVSEKDRTTLLADLKKSLLEQAADDFKAESSNGTFIVPTGETSVVTSKYDAATGDEADSLSLELTLDVLAVSYAKQDLKPLAEAVLTTELPTGYTLANQEPEILSSPREQDLDESEGDAAISAVQVDLNIAALAVPDVDLGQLALQIAGTTQQEAEGLLSQKAEIAEAKVSLFPWFARIISPTLPKDAQKIGITTFEPGSSGSE